MFNHIEKNLIKDEKIEFKTNCHWIIFCNIWWVIGFFFLFPFTIPIAILKMLTSEFAITSKRVIMKTGILSINTFELNLTKIESINVTQSFLGKSLDYGTITFIGTGGSKEKFHKVSNPMEFRRKFQELS